MKHFSITFIFVTIFTVYKTYAQNNSCNISVFQNGNLTAHNSSQIGIFGNLENNGSFTYIGETSEVGFYNPTNTIEISGNNTPEIANLIVDVPQDLILNVNTEVETGALFLDGHVITPRNNSNISLDFINTDIVVNVDNARHVDGYTSYLGTEAYTFPVGDDNRFRPIAIESGGTTDTAKAAYFFEDASAPLTFPINLDTNNTANDVFRVSNFEFWDLDGNTPTRVTLTWDIMSNISQVLNASNLNDLIVTGWNIAEQRWENLGNFGVIGSLSNGSITSNLINPEDYEALTFASSNENIELGNIELEVFNGISDGNNDGINDYFAIKNISKFPENNLKIYNRWGVKVYEADNYDAEPSSSVNFSKPKNAFRGKSNGRITVEESFLLPEGTYFYVLNYIVGVNGGEKTLAGYLYINR